MAQSEQGDDKEAPRRAGLAAVFARLGSIGTAAQASVPGLYAWGVTVAPAAYSRQAPIEVRLSAACGLVALLVGIVMERRWGARARYVAVWGLVASSSVVWCVMRSSLNPLHLDLPRGIAGMLGWALFAFASAAPALRRDDDAGARVVDDDPLRPRSQIQRGDAVYIAGGIVLALALQVVGWGISVPERALLVRLLSIACGLAVIGAATSISLARHGRPARAPAKVRLRRALPWILALVMFAVVGLVVLLRS